MGDCTPRTPLVWSSYSTLQKVANVVFFRAVEAKFDEVSENN